MLRSELQKVVPAVWRKRRNGCKVNDFCGYTERKIEKVNATSLHEDCPPEGFHAVFPNGIET